MSYKENEKKEAFRQMDKNAQKGPMDEATREDLMEQEAERSQTIRQKAEEAREVIDSQAYGRRKATESMRRG